MRQMITNKSTKDSDMVNKDLCSTEDMSFNLEKNPYFKKTMESIDNFGKGYAPPAYHKA